MIDPDLRGQTVLVTGSSGGLGRELLLSTARRGARVAIHYRSSDAAARKTATAAEAEGAAETITVQADVTDPESVEACFDRIEDEFGRVDVLVNNVGDFSPRHWESISVEGWRRVLDTNLIATYLCTKRALDRMRTRGYGRIVNIGYASSEKGLVSPTNFPYFVAKAGVLMFTRMVAADTQHDGITVNAVSPYVLETSDEFPDQLPRGRAATLRDAVQALLFFLDEDSDYVSGANLEVTGGWLPERV